MDQSYTLSRTFGDAPIDYTSFTVTNDDAINCAYMLAAGFNVMSRNLTGDFVLAVVDTKSGTVQYEGKTEQIKRDEPWSISQTFEFKADPDGENLVTFFGDGSRTVFPAKLSFAKNEQAAETLAKSAAPHIARSVLEDAYAELQAVKEVLADAGVETIPADRGVNDLSHIIGARNAQIEELKAEVEELDKGDKFDHYARSAMERKHFEQNEAARAEMIGYVKEAFQKKQQLTREHVRDDLEDRFRGMIDVLAKFLVVTGEADADEGHAVARRLCLIPED